MSRLFFVAKVGGFQEKTRKRACSWRIRGLKISLVSCHVSVGSLSSLPLARESREASKFVGHGVKGEIRQHGAEGFPGRHVTPLRVTSFFPSCPPDLSPRSTQNRESSNRRREGGRSRDFFFYSAKCIRLRTLAHYILIGKGDTRQTLSETRPRYAM